MYLVIDTQLNCDEQIWIRTVTITMYTNFINNN